MCDDAPMSVSLRRVVLYVMTVTAWRADTAFGDAGAAAIAAGLEKNVGLIALSVEGTLHVAVTRAHMYCCWCVSRRTRICVTCAFEFPVYL